jgi:hypothetical protein
MPLGAPAQARSSSQQFPYSTAAGPMGDARKSGRTKGLEAGIFASGAARAQSDRGPSGDELFYTTINRVLMRPAKSQWSGECDVRCSAPGAHAMLAADCLTSGTLSTAGGAWSETSNSRCRGSNSGADTPHPGSVPSRPRRQFALRDVCIDHIRGKPGRLAPFVEPMKYATFRQARVRRKPSISLRLGCISLFGRMAYR